MATAAEQPAYDEEGRRVRAAIAYSRLTRAKAAEEFGWTHPRTMDRTTNGKRAPTLPELRRIAKATGVPLLFLTDGWRIYRTIEASADQPEVMADLVKVLSTWAARNQTEPESATPEAQSPPSPPATGTGPAA